MPLTLNRYHADFRSGTSSHLWNEVMQQAYYDLNQAWKLMTNNRDLLVYYTKVISISQGAISAKLSELKKRLDARENKTSTNILHSSFFNDTNIVKKDKITVDRIAGIATLQPTNYWSRMPSERGEYGEPKASSALSVKIDDEEISDRTDPVFNAFDSALHTFWYLEKEDSKSTTLQIELPDGMNPSINTVKIHPFPLFCVTINNIEYHMIGGDYKSIPKWTEEYEEIISAGRTVIYFEPKDVDRFVKITMTPEMEILSEDTAIYPLGAQVIDIGYTEFEESGSVVVELQAKKGTYIGQLTSFSYDSSINEVFDSDYAPLKFKIYKSFDFDSDTLSGEIYDSETDGALVRPIDTNEVTLNKLYVECIMNRTVGNETILKSTPILRSVTIGYEPVQQWTGK